MNLLFGRHIAKGDLMRFSDELHILVTHEPLVTAEGNYEVLGINMQGHMRRALVASDEKYIVLHNVNGNVFKRCTIAGVPGRPRAWVVVEDLGDYLVLTSDVLEVMAVTRDKVTDLY